MSLPAPNLDDRRFQDIVDEAKRKVAQHCPGWTDHNVSDPGVALIELFAWMTEMTLYRLNQVPDRLYVKFLELVGVELFSAVPAWTDVLFSLAAPTSGPVLIPAGTQVGTERTPDGEQIVFMTQQDLRLVQPRQTVCATRSEGRFRDWSEELRLAAAPVPVFPGLLVGDALYLGFAEHLGGNLVRLDLTLGAAEGSGVIPDDPPIAWQTWDGAAWQNARVVADTTEGLNESGEVTLLLNAQHQPSAAGGVRSHWLRCRLQPTRDGQTGFTASPLLVAVTVTGLGGAARAVHAEPAPAEVLGISTGEPGQVFTVRRAPVLPRIAGETVVVTESRRSSTGEPQTQSWGEVDAFTDCGDQDAVCTWSGATGEIRFGPRVVGRDGKARQYGKIPPRDATVAVTGYRYGGGQRGNVGAGRLTVLLTAIPSVSSVTTNLDPARDGVDAETVDNAKQRGPMYLRSGHRAVTAEDFERLTMQAAPGSRARCVPPSAPGQPVRVLVVPEVQGTAPDRLGIDDLRLKASLGQRIRGFLDHRRLLGAQVVIDVPSYQGVKVAAVLRSAPTVRPEMVREAAEAALYRFINPIVGGPDGRGWPFEQDLSLGDLYAVLLGVPGVTRAERVDMLLADVRGDGPLTPVDAQRIALKPGELFMSWQHAVRVEP